MPESKTKNDVVLNQGTSEKGLQLMILGNRLQRVKNVSEQLATMVSNCLCITSKKIVIKLSFFPFFIYRKKSATYSGQFKYIYRNKNVRVFDIHAINVY